MTFHANFQPSILENNLYKPRVRVNPNPLSLCTSQLLDLVRVVSDLLLCRYWLTFFSSLSSLWLKHDRYFFPPIFPQYAL